MPGRGETQSVTAGISQPRTAGAKTEARLTGRGAGMYRWGKPIVFVES